MRYFSFLVCFLVSFLGCSSENAFKKCYGGTENEYGFDITLESEDFAYVSGETASSDFPTTNPYQASNAGFNDAFVTKFSTSGSSLIFSGLIWMV